MDFFKKDHAEISGSEFSFTFQPLAVTLLVLHVGK